MYFRFSTCSRYSNSPRALGVGPPDIPVTQYISRAPGTAGTPKYSQGLPYLIAILGASTPNLASLLEEGAGGLEGGGGAPQQAPQLLGSGGTEVMEETATCSPRALPGRTARPARCALRWCLQVGLALCQQAPTWGDKRAVLVLTDGLMNRGTLWEGVLTSAHYEWGFEGRF